MSRRGEVLLETIGETDTDLEVEEELVEEEQEQEEQDQGEQEQEDQEEEWQEQNCAPVLELFTALREDGEKVGGAGEDDHEERPRRRPGHVSFENIGESCTEELEEGQVEEAILEKELLLLAQELGLDIREERSSKDLEHVASYSTFLSLARLMQPRQCSSALYHIQLTLEVLRGLVATGKKDSIGLKDVLKEPKKKPAESLIEAFEAMKMRNISNVLALLEEAKKRLEKDLKSADLCFSERVTQTRLLLFVECLLKSYHEEKKIFLPVSLMAIAARERMVRKIKKHLAKLGECLGRKRSDSKWKKFSGGTMEKSRDGGQGQALLDKLHSSTCKEKKEYFYMLISNVCQT